MTLKICCFRKGLPFPKQKILDSSKLKKITIDNFQIWWKWQKFFQKGENKIGKREIARNEQFLLFP